MRLIRFLHFALIALSCSACAQEVHTLNATEFRNSIAKANIQLLDVRTASEFQAGHIANALQANWNDEKEFRERTQYIDKSKPVYVYCLVGARSAKAASLLRNQGYQVVELEGGVNAWKKAGFPLEATNTVAQITLEMYEASIPKDKTVLVDIGASWCPPCKVMEPVLDDLQKHSNITFELVRIDAGIHTELLKALDATSIPLFIIYKNGKESGRVQGVTSKAELEKLLR